MLSATETVFTAPIEMKKQLKFIYFYGKSLNRRKFSFKIINSERPTSNS